MRAVRDQRYKYIRNLAPENTYSIGGIHKGEPITSWTQDAAKDPALAARSEWLFHRPAEELYDLQQDDLEQTNLADDPALADVKARLSEQLDEWMRQQNDQGMETELKAPERQNAARQNNAQPDNAQPGAARPNGPRRNSARPNAPRRNGPQNQNRKPDSESE